MNMSVPQLRGEGRTPTSAMLSFSPTWCRFCASRPGEKLPLDRRNRSLEAIRRQEILHVFERLVAKNATDGAQYTGRFWTVQNLHREQIPHRVLQYSLFIETSHAGEPVWYSGSAAGWLGRGRLDPMNHGHPITLGGEVWREVLRWLDTGPARAGCQCQIGRPCVQLRSVIVSSQCGPGLHRSA